MPTLSEFLEKKKKEEGVPLSEFLKKPTPLTAPEPYSAEHTTLLGPTGREYEGGKGQTATELSITVTDKRLNNGRPTNIPLLTPNQPGLDALARSVGAGGSIPQEAQDRAIQWAMQRGGFPSFASIEEAEQAARQRSNEKGRMLSQRSGLMGPPREEEVQGPSEPSPAERAGFAPTAIRAGGSIGGSVLGGLAGLPLGPGGAYLGAAGGGAVGALLADYWAQQLEIERRAREEYSPSRTAVEGAFGLAGGFLPVARAGTPLLRQVPRLVGGGALLTGGQEAATEFVEKGAVDPRRVGIAAGAGGALNVGLGGAVTLGQAWKAARAARANEELGQLLEKPKVGTPVVEQPSTELPYDVPVPPSAAEEARLAQPSVESEILSDRLRPKAETYTPYPEQGISVEFFPPDVSKYKQGAEYIKQAWEEVSRRYPKIASQIRKVEISAWKPHLYGANAFFEPKSGRLVLSPGKLTSPEQAVKTLVHEFAHVAQGMRRQLPKGMEVEAKSLFEARAQETAERIIQQRTKVVPYHEQRAAQEFLRREARVRAEEAARQQNLGSLAEGVEGALQPAPLLPRAPMGSLDFPGTVLGKLESSRPRTLRDVLAGELPALEKDLPVKGQSLSRWVRTHYGRKGEKAILAGQSNIRGVIKAFRTPAHELAIKARDAGFPIAGETDDDRVRSLVELLNQDLSATRPAGKVWPMDLGAQVQLQAESRTQQAAEIRNVLSLRDEFPTLKAAAQRGFDLIEAGDDAGGRALLDRIDLAGSDPNYRQIFGDQFGGVKPAVVFALGRAGVGALAGGTQGDTPGERARNAMLGAVAGAALSPAGFRTFGQAVAHRVPDALYLYRRLAGLSYKTELPASINARLVNPEVAGRVLATGWTIDRRVAREAVPWAERTFLNKHEADILRGRVAIPEHMVAAKAYIAKMRDILADVWDKANEAGVMVGHLQNYFPQRLTTAAKDALITKRGPLFEAIREATGLQGIEADELMEEFFDDIVTKRFGHTEKHRGITLPGQVKVGDEWVDVLDNSLEVLDHYLKHAGDRIGVASEFGPDSAEAGKQVYNQLVTEGEHGQRQAAIFKNTFDTLQGIPFTHPLERAIYYVQPMTEILRGLVLTLATPIQLIAGPLQIAVKAGLGRTLKTGAKVLAHDLPFTGHRMNPGNIGAEILQSERFDGWTRTGVMSNVAYGYESMAPGTTTFRRWMRKGAEAPVQAVGMNWANTELNKIASIAGKELLFDAVAQAKAGDASQLLSVADDFHFLPEDIARWMRDPGVPSPHAGMPGPSGISEHDIAKVMQLLPARTNAYREFAVDIPRWAKSPIGRELFAFTSIVRNVGQLSYDAVKEAARGRPAPLLTLLSLPVASEVDRRLKEMLRGQDDNRESNVEVFADALLRSALLGMVGVGINDIRHFQANQPLTSAWKGIIPPWARVADRLFAAVREQNFEPVRRAVPILDVLSVQAFGAKPLQRGGGAEGGGRGGRRGR